MAPYQANLRPWTEASGWPDLSCYFSCLWKVGAAGAGAEDRQIPDRRDVLAGGNTLRDARRPRNNGSGPDGPGPRLRFLKKAGGGRGPSNKHTFYPFTVQRSGLAPSSLKLGLLQSRVEALNGECGPRGSAVHTRILSPNLMSSSRTPWSPGVNLWGQPSAHERIYVGRGFRNDPERLEKPFDLYSKMTATSGNAPQSRKAPTT